MLFALLIALQETDVAFRLQDRLPDDFNLFAEIDGVEEFLAAGEKSALADVLKEFHQLVTAQMEGPDPLDELGFDPIDLARRARGQFAAAGRTHVDMEDAGVEWVVAADFGDEKPALEATDLIGDRAVARRTGSVVWIFKDEALAASILDKTPERPLSGASRFKQARVIAGAGRGRLFGYADVEPLTDLIDAIPEPAAVEMIRETGLQSVRAYALGFGFGEKRIEQTQALLLTEKPEGMIGAVAALPNTPVDFSAHPGSTALVSQWDGRLMKAFGELFEVLVDVMGEQGVPVDTMAGLKGLFAAMSGDAPSVSSMVIEGDDAVSVSDLADPEKYIEALETMYEPMGITVRRETEGDLQVLRLDGVSPELEPMMELASVMATSGKRFYSGANLDAIRTVHRKLGEGAYGELSDARELSTLTGGGEIKGVAFTYVDVAKLAVYIQAYMKGMGAALPLPDGIGERIGEIAKKAGVGYDLLLVRDGNLIVESRSSAGVTIAGTGWAGLAAAVALPGIAQAQRNAKTVACSSNLSQLIRATYNHSITKVEPEGSFLDLHGHAFWAKIAADEELPPEILRCPITGKRYRGPASNPNLMGASDPMGLCIHEDVAVWVAKSGDTHRSPLDSPGYRRALETTVLLAGWSGAGARFAYRAEGDGKPFAIEIKAVDGDRATIEWSGDEIPTTREVLLSRADGVRIVSRAVDGRALELDVDQPKLEAALRAIRSDDAAERDGAVADLATLYPAARETIERELGGGDPELEVRLRVIREGAESHYPLLVPYPLTAGREWSNAYGSSFEAIGREEIETGEGKETAWRVRVTTGDRVREWWWSDELNALLAVRPVDGKGWVLDAVTPGR